MPKRINLDEKDKEIINILMENNKTPLRQISKKVGLGIDSVHRRIKRLEQSGIVVKNKIQIAYSKIGLDTITLVLIKFKEINVEKLKTFIAFLNATKNVVTVRALTGIYDFLLIVVSKRPVDYYEIANEIRQKFKDLIDIWDSFVTPKTYKFDEFKF